MPFRALPPQGSASASFATRAYEWCEVSLERHKYSIFEQKFKSNFVLDVFCKNELEFGLAAC